MDQSKIPQNAPTPEVSPHLPEQGSATGFEDINQYEAQANVAPSNFETGSSQEGQPAAAAAAATDAATLPAPVGVAATSAPVAPTTTPIQVVNPTAALDEDQIEKEWVDRAKNIVKNTQGDPAKRESQVAELQKDYQFKRYGRKFGES